MNIALIGFGAMGRTHAYAAQNMNYFFNDGIDARIVGVCTAHKETAISAAEKFGFEKAVTDEDELIYSPEVDIIDICTPNKLHYQTAKKAILAGKHIYCEKPLAVSFAEAEELARLVSERGVTAQIVFNYRFMSGIMRAKQIIDEGLLGNTVSFRFAFLHASCTDPSKKAGWKQDKDICGGGVLFDLGSHIIDLTRYLCGELYDISGRSQIAHRERIGVDGKPWVTNADEAFYMTVSLKNGAVGTIEANKLAFGTNDDLSFEIYGDKGALRYSLMQPNYLEFYDGRSPDGELGGERGFKKLECVGRFPSPGGIFPGVKAPTGWLFGHLHCMHAFLSAVKRGEKAYPSFDDGAYVQYVMEKAYLSDAKGGTREIL